MNKTSTDGLHLRKNNLNAPMEGSNHITYTLKGLANDTTGAPHWTIIKNKNF